MAFQARIGLEFRLASSPSKLLLCNIQELTSEAARAYVVSQAERSGRGYSSLPKHPGCFRIDSGTAYQRRTIPVEARTPLFPTPPKCVYS
jgi:hypothetical protein